MPPGVDAGWEEGGTPELGGEFKGELEPAEIATEFAPVRGPAPAERPLAVEDDELDEAGEVVCGVDLLRRDFNSVLCLCVRSLEMYTLENSEPASFLMLRSNSRR